MWLHGEVKTPPLVPPAISRAFSPAVPICRNLLNNSFRLLCSFPHLTEWKLLMRFSQAFNQDEPEWGQSFFRLLALLGWKRLRGVDDRMAVASVSF